MSDTDAENISARIQSLHLPFGFITETRFAASGSSSCSTTVDGYQGAGDGAIWTGVYLAAEAFHYSVAPTTQTPDLVKALLARIHDLASCASTGFIARTIFPKDDPLADGIKQTEGPKGLVEFDYRGVTSYWLGWPTRDQYCGAFFGLSVTYDLVGDASVKQMCTDTIEALVDALLTAHWNTRNPPTDHNGDPLPAHHETFNLYPHHKLSILQLAKHVNAAKYSAEYEQVRKHQSWLMSWSIWWDVTHLREHYYLLNLDFLFFYTLIRYEQETDVRDKYLAQYAKLTDATVGHGNAQFNMIDRALNGPDTTRDAETIASLAALLARGFRHDAVSLSYPKCGSEACDPVPVIERPYEDYLWQRHPFTLHCDHECRESPGLDYILPY